MSPFRRRRGLISRRIAADNPSAADTFIAETYRTCLNLGSFPKSHPLIADPKKRGIRRAVHGNYLIFFEIRDESVDVVHVIHGARDYQRLLFPGDER
ncbi:type II toxin-antitoxin system RelE/ParE family toxin [Rhizobium sp.]